MSNELIDPVKVKKEMNQMIAIITHPAFVDAMKQMKSSPISKRQELGKKILTVKALKKQGVGIPAGMRLTTRYFEPGKPEVLELTPDGKFQGTRRPNFPIGVLPRGGLVAWGGCACGGGLTFCGGAGGGT